MSEHQNQDQSTLETLEVTAIKSEQFIEKYLKHILIGIGVIVLAVGGYYLYKKFVAEPAAEKAAVALFKAEDKFLNGQDELAIKGEGVTSKGLDAIIKEHGGSDAAKIAEVYKGIALYDQGKYQEAITALSNYTSEDEYVGPSVKRLIGDAYAQLKKYAEAAKAYEEAAKAANNDAITPSCLIKAGHAYEKLGQKDKAKTLYQEVKDKYYASPEAQSVEADLIRVAGN